MSRPITTSNGCTGRDVHGGEVSAGVVSGLVAPTAPDNHRWETLWHYLQSGPGVFKGDLHFYKVDGDIRGKIDEIDGKAANLYLLTGEYDYSCTTEGTLDIAKRTGAQATIMKGLGHFPMSEDPPKFIGYLLPVLEKIRARARREQHPAVIRGIAGHRRHVNSTQTENPCPTPKPSTPCSPPPGRPARSSVHRRRCATTRCRTTRATTRGGICSTPSA